MHSSYTRIEITWDTKTFLRTRDLRVTASCFLLQLSVCHHPSLPSLWLRYACHRPALDCESQVTVFISSLWIEKHKWGVDRARDKRAIPTVWQRPLAGGGEVFIVFKITLKSRRTRMPVWDSCLLNTTGVYIHEISRMYLHNGHSSWHASVEGGHVTKPHYQRFCPHDPNLDRAGKREEGPPSDWPVGLPVGISLVGDWCRRV